MGSSRTRLWGREGGELRKEKGKRLGQGKQWVERAVVMQIGVHLAFWPSRVQWGTRAKTREVVALRNGILRRVEVGELGVSGGGLFERFD